nr:hypothetical protein [Tanacetum cinerariifolium]
MDSPSKFLMYLRFLQVIINAQVDDLSSHTNQYTSFALTQKVFANMRREDDEVKVPFAPTLQSPTFKPTPPPQESITITPQAQPTPSSPPLAQPQPDTSESSITLLNTLMETYATLSQKFAHLEQDKIAQALDIIKLKKRVQKLEKQRRSKYPGLKRLMKEENDVEQVEEVVHRKIEGRYSPSKFLMYLRFLQVIINAQVDDLSSHTNQYTSFALTQKVFANMRREDDEVKVPFAPTLQSPTFKPTPPQQEPITITPQAQPAPSSPPLAQPQPDTSESSITLLNTLMETYATLSQKVAHLEQDKIAQALDIIKLKKRVQKLEKKRRSKYPGLKRLMKVKEKHLDNIRKYQSLNRKLISVAQAKKNMIVYLKNMAGYKMEHFKGMTYEKVRKIFKREYNKVHTLFKHDKDEEPTKKRVVEETLLQESFRKLKPVEVSGFHSTQDIPTGDPNEISEEDVKNMLEIVPVSKFKVEALQGRKEDDNAAIKDANAAEPIVFDDEEVTMTMAHTLIKMKAKKARLLD